MQNVLLLMSVIPVIQREHPYMHIAVMVSPATTLQARDTVHISLRLKGWHTAIYRSTVKLTTSQAEIKLKTYVEKNIK